MKIRRRIGGRLYEVRGRPAATGTKTFFLNLHALLRTPRRRVLWGQPWISVEVMRCVEALRYQLWVPESERALVERLLRGSYGELELVPIARADLGAGAFALAELRLAHDTYLPLRASHSAE